MTLFVAGVHAVGKTYVAKPVAERLGIRYATASQLIREERGLATWTPGKEVREVDENQLALTNAVKRILAGGEELLLDGHFVLRQSPGVHIRLPLEVFDSLQCSAVLILTTPPSVLMERLKGRGDTSWQMGEIDEFNRAEVQHGCAVAESLGVPVSVLDSPEVDSFEFELKSLMLRHDRK
jgi:adenylate kinase